MQKVIQTLQELNELKEKEVSNGEIIIDLTSNSDSSNDKQSYAKAVSNSPRDKDVRPSNFKCKQCKHVELTRVELKAHMENKHPGNLIQVCHKCDFSDKNSQVLKKHMQDAHPEQFFCTMCNFRWFKHTCKRKA